MQKKLSSKIAFVNMRSYVSVDLLPHAPLIFNAYSSSKLTPLKNLGVIYVVLAIIAICYDNMAYNLVRTNINTIDSSGATMRNRQMISLSFPNGFGCLIIISCPVKLPIGDVDTYMSH